MSDEKGGPHDRLEGERQEAQDEASASAQDSNSGHVEHTAQEEARGSERPSLSPQLPTHEKARDSEKSSPGPQPPTHEEAHSSEKSFHSPQPPTHEQGQHASVKRPPIAKRKARRGVGANRKRDEETEQMKQERRLENERRLEGQRREYERKLEARRKAEEAAAAARTQSEGEERSTNGGELPQRLSGSEETQQVRHRRQQQQSPMEESVKAECREDAKGGSPTLAIKMDDDQKVHDDDDAETVGAPGPRVLEHDTGATCLAITDDKHSESHLIMMAHVSDSFLSLLSALAYDGNEKNRSSTESLIVIVHWNVECRMFSRLQQCP